MFLSLIFFSSFEFGVKIQPSSHVVKRDFCVIFKHSQNKELTTRHWHVNTQLDLTVMFAIGSYFLWPCSFITCFRWFAKPFSKLNSNHFLDGARNIPKIPPPVLLKFSCFLLVLTHGFTWFSRQAVKCRRVKFFAYTSCFPILSLPVIISKCQRPHFFVSHYVIFPFLKRR